MAGIVERSDRRTGGPAFGQAPGGRAIRRPARGVLDRRTGMAQ